MSASDPDVPTRGSLLARLKDPRDDKSWSEFAEAYRPLILGWCRRQGLAPPDADDVTQEVLLRLVGWLQKGEYDPEKGGFRKYLRRMVHNAAVDLWRKRQPAAELPHDVASDDTPVDALADEISAAPVPPHDLRLVALEQVRRKALWYHWEVFWLRESDEALTMQEIIERVSKDHEAALKKDGVVLTVGNMNMAVVRLRGRLRDLLKALQEPKAGGE